MQNIVLDTNNLIISISSRSSYNEVWKSFLRGDYTLCITNKIIEEYQEVIARNINPWLTETIVTTIINRSLCVMSINSKGFQKLELFVPLGGTFGTS